jgi:aryl-alcohol dehydrogenase (NADP+)
MKYIRLGRTGLKVSRMGLGCFTYGSKSTHPWLLEEAEAMPLLRHAMESGITLFDTADSYSAGQSEILLGKAIREYSRRHDIIVATKVGRPFAEGPNDNGLSRKHIMHSIDDSLRRLHTDYVDIYQIHRFDPDTPIEETMGALNDIVRSGKARYIGASSMHTWQFVKMNCMAEKMGWARFASMQNLYNLAYREDEREMLPYCLDAGIGVIPWAPLGRGFLAGNRQSVQGQGTPRALTDEFARRDYYRPADFRVVEAITAVARRRGVCNAIVAYAWLLHKSAVTSPFMGATRAEYIDAACAAVDFELTDDEIRSLEAPYEPRGIVSYA